ncbi:MAG: hypothetical protein PHP64_03985 [Actinomycetota bacterium]|nr:hypothetical protein [Actinomycetota bacterium]
MAAKDVQSAEKDGFVVKSQRWKWYMKDVGRKLSGLDGEHGDIPDRNRGSMVQDVPVRPRSRGLISTPGCRKDVQHDR